MRNLLVAIAGVGLLLGIPAAAFFILLTSGSTMTVNLASDTCQADVPIQGTAAGGVASLDGEQRRNAATIIATGKDMGLPAYGQQIGVATAMTESTLHNVNYGDTAGPDSRGLFQQRDSWGPEHVRMDPAGAAGLFYERLKTVRGWEQMPLWQAAQTVQVSAFPLRYQEHAAIGAAAVQELGDGTRSVACTGEAEPGGPKVEGAIRWAMNQRGKPYVWGATGPDSFDCSGLMLRAWQSVGVTIPRVSAEQWTAGRPVPLAQAQRGDLLFWSSDGTPAGIHHVAMYLGNNQMVEAQQTGVPVHTRQVGLAPAEDELLPQAIRVRA